MLDTMMLYLAAMAALNSKRRVHAKLYCTGQSNDRHVKRIMPPSLLDNLPSHDRFGASSSSVTRSL
jgi:hypothetical protein